MTETTPVLDFDRLKEAVKGSASAFRCRRRLQPAGSEEDKVFPPTFAGAVYAIEKRRVPGREGPSTCVRLDSVQSRANRMDSCCRKRSTRIYAMAQAKRIPASKIRGQWRIRRSELDQWTDAQPRDGDGGRDGG